MPVCVFHYTDVYIYLSSFITNYEFINDNTNGICVHRHRHNGVVVQEYTNKLATDDNAINQKGMVPQLTDVEMNLLDTDCSSNSGSSLSLLLDYDRLTVPQNMNTTSEHMSTITTVCLNGQPSRYYTKVNLLYSFVIYEDCRSITNCPNGWSDCTVDDFGICNAPSIDCFGSITPLGYDTCVDIVDNFDYTGCNSSTLNPGTYYVSNTYTDLNGYEWYHLCDQGWFTSLTTVRSCTTEDYNQLQCLDTLSRGPSCTIETSFDDSGNSNSQSMSVYLVNTPYLYNIASLGINDSMNIALAPVQTTGRFQIIFTKEQVACHNV